MTDTGVRVWDPLVRVFHWSLALSVLLAWISAEGWGRWHEWIGYGALALVAVRLIWGLVGSRYARFAAFVRGPAATLAYARSVLAHRDRRHLGHNPLGGWMIIALLVMVTLTGFTGWLYTTDAYWGVEWVEDVHEGCANTLFVLIGLHVAGVALTSWRHGENLAAAMLHGQKRQAGSNDMI